jgi:hypothetical protein
LPPSTLTDSAPALNRTSAIQSSASVLELLSGSHWPLPPISSSPALQDAVALTTV